MSLKLLTVMPAIAVALILVSRRGIAEEGEAKTPSEQAAVSAVLNVYYKESQEIRESKPPISSEKLMDFYSRWRDRAGRAV